METALLVYFQGCKMTTRSSPSAMMAAPAGYVVDFAHPTQQLAGCMYGVWSVGMAHACLFFFQKLYVQVAIRNRFGISEGKWKSGSL